MSDYGDCQLIDSPDLTGLGVRIAFYVQASLTIVVAYLPHTDVESSYWTMTITAFALFASALILHGNGQLSLYLGITVSILLQLHALAALFVLLGHTASKKLLIGGKFHTAAEEALYHRTMRALRLQGLPVIIMSAAFSLFIWSSPSTFGSSVACNTQTTVVIIGRHLSAIGSGRKVGLAFSSVFLFYAVFFSILDIASYYVGRKHPSWLDNGLMLPGEHNILSYYASVLDNGSTMARDLDTTRPASPPPNPLMPFFCAPVILVLLVISNELTIDANAHLPREESFEANKWTMGQIFPIIMLLVPSVSILQYFRRSYHWPRIRKIFAMESKLDTVNRVWDKQMSEHTDAMKKWGEEMGSLDNLLGNTEQQSGDVIGKRLEAEEQAWNEVERTFSVVKSEQDGLEEMFKAFKESVAEQKVRGHIESSYRHAAEIITKEKERRDQVRASALVVEA